MRFGRLRIWWFTLTHPATMRVILASAMEFAGIGLVLGGLYFLHPLAFVIGLGGICLLLAQGLSRRDET
jgi:hypothetical protein